MIIKCYYHFYIYPQKIAADFNIYIYRHNLNIDKINHCIKKFEC